MASEEIRLNEGLEEAGVKTIETDLGEYILQLAGEHPVHIIAPAAEKTVQDVAELSEFTGEPVEPQPEALSHAGPAGSFEKPSSRRTSASRARTSASPRPDRSA